MSFYYFSTWLLRFPWSFQSQSVYSCFWFPPPAGQLSWHHKSGHKATHVLRNPRRAITLSPAGRGLVDDFWLLIFCILDTPATSTSSRRFFLLLSPGSPWHDAWELRIPISWDSREATREVSWCWDHTIRRFYWLYYNILCSWSVNFRHSMEASENMWNINEMTTLRLSDCSSWPVQRLIYPWVGSTCNHFEPLGGVWGHVEDDLWCFKMNPTSGIHNHRYGYRIYSK